MIRHTVILPKYDNWEVYCYFATTRYAVDEIMERLHSIGCDSATARDAYSNLCKGELNTGLCYSNFRQRRSVMVVALSSSPAEFINSMHHELTHLQSHIGKVFGLSATGEDVAYLSGEIARELYPHIMHLLCECCRKKNNYE